MNFYGQFVIHKRDETFRVGWRRFDVGEWHVETHPVLPAKLAHGNMTLGYRLEHDAGRYAEVRKEDSAWRLYLDPIGSLACVYSPEQQCVASTPRLIPDVEQDRELIQAYGMPQSCKFYPAGLTPYKGVHRLLPNHYLDLETMTPHRHWPMQDFKLKDDTDDLTFEIANRLRYNIKAVAEKRQLYLSLTAGQDSRMLLAAAPPSLREQMKFFTYAELSDTVDLHIAEKLAERFGLSWTPLPYESPTQSDMDNWHRDVGDSVSGAIAKHACRFGQLDPTRVRMPGLAGEIGRAYYWRKGDWGNVPEDATLLERMKVPATHKPTLERMEAWRKSVPLWLNTYDLLDLAYIEHRLGCWAGPALYGTDKYFAGQIVPLADRYIIERMMSLPPEYRMEQRMAPDVIRTAWPELLKLPFNRYTGVRRYLSRHGLMQCARWVKQQARGIAKGEDNARG